MDLIATSPYNPKLQLQKIVIYDSTLRDGEQTPGVAFSKDQKVAIASKLDQIRIPQIEAGFPAVSVAELESIKEIASLGLKADILALSRITKSDIDCTLQAGVDMVLLFVATSDIHLKYKLNKDRNWIIERTVEALDYCCDHGLAASVSAEDSTRTDLDFLIKFYKAAEDAGARRLGLTDTVGCATPEAIAHLVSKIRLETQVPLSIHLHNDFGLALANAISGVAHGAEAVTTTVNGIGERAGNVPLEQFVGAMKFLYGADLGIDTTGLKGLCEMVAQYSKLPISRNHPLVGENVFSHESGIHVAAVLNCPQTYESIPPEVVGNKRHLILGKHTGLNYIKKRLEELHVSATEEQACEILRLVKETGEKKGRVSDNEFKEMVRKVLS